MEAAMRKKLLLGIATGALLLAGCSGTTADSPDGKTEATEDAAAGDTPYQNTLGCEGKSVSVPIPKDASSVKVEAVGAAGDAATSGSENRGMGGTITAEIPIVADWGTTLYAKVGCRGDASDHSRYPNGGRGGSNSDNHGGGGSTSLEKQDDSSYDPIIMAGAGGGGNGGYVGGSVNQDGTGGSGAGSYAPSGATQSAAGIAGGWEGNKCYANPGYDGKQYGGGDGGYSPFADGGGGGGGYYGGAGGCGASKDHNATYSSGSAGSSWADKTAMDVTYSVPGSSQLDGTLKYTFMCNVAGGGTEPCKEPA